MTRLLVAALLLAPTIVHAEGEEGGEHHHGPWEVRAGLEAPLYKHASEGSENIGDAFAPELGVMISYVLEEHRLSLDLELGEGVQLTGEGSTQRTGTVVRPGVAWSPVEGVPVFVTGLLPVHLEPSPVILQLRLGAGVDIHLGFAKLYIEADVDFPLAGDGVDSFKEQELVLATGLMFHL